MPVFRSMGSTCKSKYTFSIVHHSLIYLSQLPGHSQGSSENSTFGKQLSELCANRGPQAFSRAGRTTFIWKPHQSPSCQCFRAFSQVSKVHKYILLIFMHSTNEK